MRNRRAVALMVVLWVLVVLGGIAAALTVETRRSTDTQISQRARLASRYAAESGVVATLSTLTRALEQSGGDAARRQRAFDRVMQSSADTIALGAQRVQVAVIDVSARLDVNAASADAFATLFAAAGAPALARRTAVAIKAFIGGTGGNARLITSLEQLRTIDGVDEGTVRAALPYLTVDGDGHVNRRTAPRIVLDAAAGDVQDEPSRLLIIARGWMDGHPLTHELQTVVAVQGDLLSVVRSREVTR